MNEIILFGGKARYLKDIKLLQFYDEFNELIEKYISHPIFDELEQLHFGKKYNQSVYPLNKCKTLKHLVFGDDFNIPTDFLPPNLQSIIYGFSFNQEINNLPQIKALKLGFNFCQNLDSLPASLIHLELLFHYPYPIGHMAASPYTSPYLSVNRNLVLGNLPNGLETLIITYLKGVNLMTLPRSIKKLVTEEIPLKYYASYYNLKINLYE